MAAIVAGPLVSFLADLLVQETKLLGGVREKVEQMQTELKWMQCFLEDADSKRGDKRVHNCVVQIREATYDAQDVIETFAVKVALRRRGGVHYVLKRYLCIKEWGTVHKVGLKIEAFNTNIASLTRSLQTLGIQSIGESAESSTSNLRLQQLRRSYTHVVEDDIIGFEEEVKVVVEHLVNKKGHNCEAVSIWGMGGLGKTTLAKMVYHHSEIRRHFDCVAWAYISQQCKEREVLEGILIKLLSPSKEEREKIGQLKFEELASKLCTLQIQKKCLVILDDIWHVKDWYTLSPGFPNKGAGSKILLTTRKREVAEHVNQPCFPYELRHLTEEESWTLFEKKSSSSRKGFRLTIEMKKEAKEMIKHCGGLPLAIVVLRGLLATKHTLKQWEMVRRNISRDLGKGKGPVGVPVEEILALSYLDLPYHLKPCFLYFSNLPEDHHIRADTLVHMWAAEGIIVGEIGEGETMMDVGMGYLGELVQRCMVQVQLTRYSKRIKLCRLHDLMRDMCLSKAKEENFVEVLLMGAADSASSSSSFSSSTSTITTTKVRRLALHYYKGIERTSRNYDRLGTMNDHHHIRSCQFYLFGKKLETEEWQRILKSLLKGFKLLRVLYLERLVNSGLLPGEIGNLIHLRYLGLVQDKYPGIMRLPYSIENLAFLETLDLRSTAIVKMPNFLWKLKQLRHLYLPVGLVGLGRKKLRLDGLSKLETLVNFDSDKFDVGCFSKLMNLRNLRVNWVDLKDLAVILESPIISNSNSLLRNSSINIEGDFETQEGRRLLREVSGCHHLHKLYLHGSLNTLPDLFPPNLTRLSLSYSKLKEDPMPTLEKLPNLRILYFLNYHYTEKKMVCSAPSSTTPSSSSRGGDYGCEEKEGGFPQLKFLHLNKLTKLKEWTIEDGAMPGLLRLDIWYCKKLEEIPDGLRFVTTLQELEIIGASEALKDRLREGGEDFYKVQHVPSIKFTR